MPVLHDQPNYLSDFDRSVYFFKPSETHEYPSFLGFMFSNPAAFLGRKMSLYRYDMHPVVDAYIINHQPLLEFRYNPDN